MQCDFARPHRDAHREAEGYRIVELVGRHNLVNATGEPRDIAALAAFLASEDSRFITGQIICCDGGLLAHLPQNADHLAYIAKHQSK